MTNTTKKQKMTEQEEIELYGKNPKDYAKALVDSFKVMTEYENLQYGEMMDSGKECALICIKEMYKLPIFRCWDIKPKYLVKVEEEIKKL